MPNMHHRDVTAREAAENILKTILILHIQCGHAYVSEIAEDLEMNLTTTYTVISQMVRDGLLQPLEGGRGRRAHKQSMTFTPEGHALARRIFARHQIIQKWLNRLGIPMDEADMEACGIEHGISDRTMQILEQHVQMATAFTQGLPENAARTIAEMRQQLSGGSTEQTFSEKTMDLLETLGGTEGIAHKSALLDRAGGEKDLSALLDLVNEIGGLAELRQREGIYRSLETMLTRYGGVRGLRTLLELTEQLGGAEGLRALAQQSRQCGGTEAMLRLIDAQYRFWSARFSAGTGSTGPSGEN